MKKDKLGEPFKKAESQFDVQLVNGSPVIIRVDGRAFHTYTRKFEKPFDLNLHEAMVDTAAALCKEMQNARFAYTQSDEISILLWEKTPESQPWFGNRVMKMASVSASVATNVFNRSIRRLAYEEDIPLPDNALFDSRVFNLIPEQVQGYFSWRQQDAVRNSVSMLAQAHFSSKKLHGKNRRDMLDMLKSKGVDWSILPDWQRKGSLVTKVWTEKQGPNGEIVHRSSWVEADHTPWFQYEDSFFEALSAEELNV
jgi:tRNA(His) 5'-end guanylyltransferase